MSTIGDRIYKRRKALKLTQEALAQKLYSKKRNICNYEKDIRQPDLETLVRIADALSCTTDYLLGTDAEPTREETDLVKATGLSGKAVAVLMSFHNTIDDDSVENVLSDLICSSHLYDMAHYYTNWIKQSQRQALAEKVIEFRPLVDEETAERNLQKWTEETNELINERIKGRMAVDGARYSVIRAFESFLTETEQKEQKGDREE